MNNEECAKEVIKQMEILKDHIYKYLAGVKVAGKRARVKMIELEKLNKKFRKLSVEK